MTVQELQEQIKQLDDTEFQQLLAWVVTPERERRAAQPAIEQAKQEAESETATKIAQQLADEHPELVEKPVESADGEVREWEPCHPLKTSTHYRYGDKTRHGGKVWRDVLDSTRKKLNVWEPGAQGIDERYWVEETEPETPETSETPEATQPEATRPEDSETPESTPEPEASEDAAETPTVDPFVQPTSETPYKKGDKVLYNGAVYESTIDSNVWAPDAYPQGWKKL